MSGQSKSWNEIKAEASALGLKTIGKGITRDVLLQQIAEAKSGQQPQTDSPAQEQEQVLTRERTKRETAYKPEGGNVDNFDGGNDVLYAPQRPGFIRRWVNDKPGQIEKRERQGYTVVEDLEKVGQQQASGRASRISTAWSQPVGGGMTGVLMEIPEELYNQRAQKRQAKVSETEEAILTPPESFQGDAIGTVKKEYLA